ncbi:MAG TPA: PIN domain-containing protein [Dehalococcoidia bacterium]|jgi:predicted nucleic acid-binding protein
MVIADSSVWIEFLKRPHTRIGQEMTRLLRANEVLMVGTVLAEVLQGANNDDQIESIGSRMLVLPFLEADQAVWRQAGSLASQLRRQGQTTALSDIVIAVQAIESDHAVFTTDTDFRRVPGLKLHEVL